MTAEWATPEEAGGIILRSRQAAGAERPRRLRRRPSRRAHRDRYAWRMLHVAEGLGMIAAVFAAIWIIGRHAAIWIIGRHAAL